MVSWFPGRGQDRLAAPRSERHGPLRSVFAVCGQGFVGLGDVGLGVLGLGVLRIRKAQEFQASQRVLGEPLVPGQVAGGDQGVLGTYRLSPHSGNRSSSGTGVTATVSQPSGSKSRRTSSAPPRAGSAGISMRSGRARPGSSGRAVQWPASALRNAPLSATAKREDAA
ncbi:hypothetical protein GCM10010347_46310 [Streptomyces cirratus]|uniref:Uncharacterized protein n=1 Tax=Streptomyces cirratus TaxID=68187 RepID=A0ABQ3F1P7_9ACTN|nr:hypothetical protein GCM10010347_46310 [Streptomyces cirratus]